MFTFLTIEVRVYRDHGVRRFVRHAYRMNLNDVFKLSVMYLCVSYFIIFLNDSRAPHTKV